MAAEQHMAEEQQNDAIRERHRQTDNELKVSDTSYKPLLVMGLVLAALAFGIAVTLTFCTFVQDQEAALSSEDQNALVTQASQTASAAPAVIQDKLAAASSSEAPKLLPDPPPLSFEIMGESIISPDTMAALYNKRDVEYPAEEFAEDGAPTIEEYCQLCAEEASAEGVRAEVLFAQAMHETAWLQFGNQVSADQNNFGGLGAVNSGGEGERFPDVRTGLRAQVQHLKAYASTEDLKNEIVDTRFELVERGCAPMVHDLGGRWAYPGDGYGDAIMAIVADLYEIEYGKQAEKEDEGQ